MTLLDVNDDDESRAGSDTTLRDAPKSPILIIRGVDMLQERDDSGETRHPPQLRLRPVIDVHELVQVLVKRGTSARMDREQLRLLSSNEAFQKWCSVRKPAKLIGEVGKVEMDRDRFHMWFGNSHI